jgi:GntR family transcriptional regulator
MINVGYVWHMAGEALNPYADQPLYVQLAAILRRKIEHGELAHLAPLPSETTLTQEYGISRDTARRAVQALRDEGLVFTVPQRGTFVGPRPTT